MRPVRLTVASISLTSVTVRVQRTETDVTDADSDGAHIRCLLLTLFARYMRPLLDAGRVFAAMPPLHRLEISAVKRGDKPEIRYTYSEEEFQAAMRDIDRAGRVLRSTPQRYKGLGEMDAEQLADTTMDRASRTLRRMTVADAESAEATFDLLMGSDVPPRKEFLVAGAEALDRQALDV